MAFVHLIDLDQHNQKTHPAAAKCVNELIALPIDQRYNLEDMDQLADIVISCL